MVLVSATGPAPKMVEAIAGASVKGSWWGHPEGKRIFAVLQEVQESPDVLVCRLVGGKVSLVHRRLWPALVRAAERFPADNLARVRQEHTAEGHHLNTTIAFPEWVDGETLTQANGLSLEAALAALPSYLSVSRPGA